MPELPEVETVVRGLRPILIGKGFRTISSFAPSAVALVGPSFRKKKFSQALAGKSVGTIARRGKNILITCTDGSIVWVHLKMTGQFRYVRQDEVRDKHDLLIFELSDSDATGMHLRYNDYRRFGRLRLLTTDELQHHPSFARLGPEPFDLTAEQFVERAKRRKRQLKAALLDQTFIAGVGNIYADEALFAARLHPRKLTNNTSATRLAALHTALTEILGFAIEHMGSSIDSYAGVNGEGGSFQTYLKAYGREDLPCERCRTTIRRELIGQRSAHYCPRCQRL